MLVHADLDGDGELERVTVEHDLGLGGRPRYIVIEKFEDGGYLPHRQFSVLGVAECMSQDGDKFSGITIADIDGDGDLDIKIWSETRLRACFRQTNPTLKVETLMGRRVANNQTLDMADLGIYSCTYDYNFFRCDADCSDFTSYR